MPVVLPGPGRRHGLQRETNGTLYDWNEALVPVSAPEFSRQMGGAALGRELSAQYGSDVSASENHGQSSQVLSYYSVIGVL